MRSQQHDSGVFCTCPSEVSIVAALSYATVKTMFSEIPIESFGGCFLADDVDPGLVWELHLDRPRRGPVYL